MNKPFTSPWRTKFKNYKLWLLLSLISINIGLIFATYWMWNNSGIPTFKEYFNKGYMMLINIHNSEVMLGPPTPQIELHTPTTMTDELAAEQTVHTKEPSYSDYRSPPLKEQDKQKAKIVIVITNLGLNQEQLRRALEMPTNFTLGFSAYTGSIGQAIDQAVTAGFECLMQLPMQPIDYKLHDPGPFALLLANSNSQNNKILEELLLKSHKFIGFYSDEEEVITQSINVISNVFEKLVKENLIYINGNVNSAKVMADYVQPYPLWYLQTDTHLNKVVDQTVLIGLLQDLERKALEQKIAVLCIRAYPMYLDTLYNWSKTLNTEKIIIAPASAAIK